MSKLNKAYKSKFGERLSKEQEMVSSASKEDVKITEDSLAKKVDHTQNITVKTATKSNPNKNSKNVEVSTTQTVNSSTNQRTLRGGQNTKSKTFFLPPEFHEMFEYIKWKKKTDHSKYLIQALEESFKKEFGSDWRSIIES
jgi:hypothetical protein